MLDIWPALPLIIWGVDADSPICVGNIVAALKFRDRVCHIGLWFSKNLGWEMLLGQPFPELTNLELSSMDEMTVVPDSFLVGSVPRLQELVLDRIPFPGLPKLLLSTTHLVHLDLDHIPHSGYFSPDAMVAALSTLIGLDFLLLRFESPESCPDLETRRLPPSTRSVLPALTEFWFGGVTEYLEDLLTDIDAPQLNKLSICFFNDSVFDMPQLIQFISRTPMSSTLENAHIALNAGTACVSFRPQIDHDDLMELKVSILCEGLDWQLSSLEQVCTSCLLFLPTLGGLYINEYTSSEPDWKDNIGNGPWRELLRPFTAMKNLHLSEKIALRIGPALQEHVEGGTTELLPALENIFLEGLESSGRAHCAGRHWTVRCRPTGRRSLYSNFWMGRPGEGTYLLGVIERSLPLFVISSCRLLSTHYFPLSHFRVVCLPSTCFALAVLWHHCDSVSFI